MTTQVTIINNGPNPVVVATQVVQGGADSWVPAATVPPGEFTKVNVSSIPGGQAISVTEAV
jgi:hypothetical protein